MKALGEMLSDEQDQKKLNHLFGLADKILNKDIPLDSDDFNTDYLEDMENDDEGDFY